MTIWSLIFGFCIQSSILIVNQIIKHSNMPVLGYKKLGMKKNGLKKFRTIASEVSSFVGNPVSHSPYSTLEQRFPLSVFFVNID